MNVVGFVEDYSQEDVVEDNTYKIYKQPVDLAKLIKEKSTHIVETKKQEILELLQKKIKATIHLKKSLMKIYCR